MNIKAAENRFFLDVINNALKKFTLRTDINRLMVDFPERAYDLEILRGKLFNEIRNQEEMYALKTKNTLF